MRAQQLRTCSFIHQHAPEVIPRLLLVGHLRQDWAPTAFIVSFKLETDDALLRLKAETALRRYRVHAVVRPRTLGLQFPLEL